MSSPGRHVVAVLLLTLAVTGCTALPEAGTVQAGEAPAATGSAAPFDYNPPGPGPHAGPAQIVTGFLRALQATPVSTEVAAEFLTAEAAKAWQPQRRTLVYGSQRVRPAPGGAVAHLQSVFRLDGDGRWVSGSPAAGEESHRDLGFRVVSEDGAWRIADPPDAMIVPQSHFGARYRQYSLYFFDASGSVLVPEPVYLPTGPQAATMLVNGLRDGPGTNRKGVERSFVPRGSPVGAVIGVRADGVADVPLPAAVKRLDPADLERALAQVAWTLRQIDDIARFRVMVAGHPMTLPTGKTTADVNGWGEYSPAIGPASTDLFGLRDDHVVQLVGGSELQAVSWRGSAVTDPRSLGVDMTGQHFGLVSEDGSVVYLLNRSGPAEGRVIEAYAGTDVLRPMWDWTDRMWLVDRTYEGTRVVLVNRGRSRTVPAPGLGDVRLRAAAMSRDGTRMAVVTAPRAGGMSELLMLRVVRRRDGVPVRLTAPRVIRMSTPLQRVRDVGWRDPVSVAVLTRPSPRTSQVVLAACDGSSAAVPSSAAVDVLFDEGVSLAASPGGPVALMVATADGSLHALNAQGRWDFDVAPRDLGSPTFVG